MIYVRFFSCLSFILGVLANARKNSFSLLLSSNNRRGWKMMRMIIICEDGKRKSQVRFIFCSVRGFLKARWERKGSNDNPWKFTCGGFNLRNGNYWIRTWLCHFWARGQIFAEYRDLYGKGWLGEIFN